MKNKFIVGLLTLGFATTLGVACNDTEQEDGITLVNFEATQTAEAADIGDLYELRRLVKDEDGNEYVLSYEVKDSTGKVVSVVANCFEVTDMGGYTITYTVILSDGEVRTSVVTLPTRDGDGPSILFDALAAGEVGKEYVLPEVTVVDLSEIKEQSVKVYLVGTELTEIILTEKDGKYSFLPSKEGTYRLCVSAKDAAGNRTERTADFNIERILVGEVFNPASSIANTKISFEGVAYEYGNNVAKEFVTAKENKNATYGGSYVRASAMSLSNVWGTVLLTSRFEATEYESYDYVNTWVYVESPDNTSTNVLFFDDVDLTRSIKTNEWTLVRIERAKFFELLATKHYFISTRFTESITGIRVGEVLAVNDATVTVTAPEQKSLSGESADVEFSVTATPANTECVVTVTNEAGEEQEVVALGNGKYKVTLTALGDYTIKAEATNGKYGVDMKKLSMVDANRIVVNGEYAESVALDEKLTIYDASVILNDALTSEVVTVKVYKQNGAAWVDVSSEIAGGKYKPTEEGKIKVEYTFENFAPIAYEIAVVDYSEIFDPANENAAKQVLFGTNNTVYQGTEKVFVSAEENTDTTYGGAYLSATATNRNAWGNLWITPKFTAEDYERYDAVAAWIYVVATDNTQANVLFGANTYTQYTQMITPNQWVQVIIPMELYLPSVVAGTPVFCAIDYRTSATAVRVGEITAVNYAELEISEPTNLILSGASTDVEFSVTATPADSQYVVSVKNANGEEQTVVALGNGNYKVTVSALGNYTITVTATGGKVGSAEKKFTVVDAKRIVVDGEYEEAYAMGEELELISAEVMNGNTITGDTVTVKVYVQNGTEWIDKSSAIVSGTYKLTEECKIKVEYTFGTLASITYEIAVCDYSVIFKPDSTSAASQVSFGTNNNVYQGTQKVFVSAEENTDTTYGGAYLSATPTNRTDWGNLWITPNFTAADYERYDVVKAWVYVVSEDEAPVTALFANNGNTQVLTPNQWVQVTIPMSVYAPSVEAGTPVFIGLNFNSEKTAITGVRVGEIFADNVVEDVDPSCFFKPDSINALGQISTTGKAANENNVAMNVVAGSEDAVYNGAYVEVKAKKAPSSNQWCNIFLTPNNAIESYSEYTTLKVWIYLEASYEFASAGVAFLNGQHSATAPTNTWCQIEIDVAKYMENSAGYFVGCNFNAGKWGFTAIRIGAITAVK